MNCACARTASALTVRSICACYGEFDRLSKRRFGFTIGEMRNRINCALAIMPRAIQRIVNRIMRRQQRARMLQIRIRNPVAKHRVTPEFLFIGTATDMGQNDGQGYLAIAEIVAAVLAHRCAIGHIVNGVVDQLKCDPQIAAIRVQRHFLRVPALGHDRRNPANSPT